ncbi:MAG: ankyrin repeat domain-containing protein [Bacteroides sp.]|nr:ankyrin repeat domain-containing protein [Bacteroides sp.]
MNLTTLLFNERFDEAQNFIIENTPNLNYVSAQNSTPLLVAIGTGNLNVVEILLKYGADPNFMDERINTPLIEAIEIAVEESEYNSTFNEEPRVDIIKLLLKYGAKIDLVDNLGRTPVSFAQNYHLPAQKLFEGITDKLQ